MATVIGTSFATSGFSYDPNISPNSQSFSSAVLAVFLRRSGSIAPGTAGALTPAAFANPTAKVSSTATNGTSTLAMRADAAPALDFAMDPVTWTGVHTFANQTLTIDGQPGTQQARININAGTNNPAYSQYGIQGAIKGRVGACGTSSDLGVPLALVNDMVVTALGTIARIFLQAPGGVVLAGTGFMLRMTTYQGTSSQSYQDWFTGTTRRGYFGYGNSADDTLILANEVAASPISLRNGALEQFRIGTNTSATVPVLQGRGFAAAGLVDMSPDASSFNGTATGLTTSPTAAIVWSKQGNQVTIVVGTVSGSSNATSFSIGQLPAELSPARSQVCAIPTQGLADNSAGINTGSVSIGAGATSITFLNNNSSTGFTAAGTKSVNRSFTFTYLLN